MKYKNLMAKALYDNVPESPEELAFRKGDILTVIEQNTGGLEGWWLCSLHGRQGIAPGNRLKLLIGPMFEAPSSATPSPPQGHQQRGGAGAQGLYQVPAEQQNVYQVPPEQQSVYQVPPRGGLCGENTPNKVVTPTRVGQSYVYSPGQHNQQDLYDVPPIRSQGVYDVPPGQMYPAQYAGARNQGVYDVPPPQPDSKAQGIYDVPPSALGVYSVRPCRTNAGLQEGNYDFPQSLKHKQEGIYDVPPPSLTKATQSPQSHYDFPLSYEPPPHHLNSNGNEGIYDVPPSALQSGVGAQQDIYDFPRNMQPPQLRDSASDGNGIYDVPAQEVRAVTDVTDGVNRLSFSSTGSSRSSMSTSSSSTGSAPEGRLALDADAAVQRLYRLQQGVELSVGALQSMAASPHWRTFPRMEQHTNDLRTVLDRVRAAIRDFIVFGRGAAVNAASLSDSSLHCKLRRQLGRLEDSQQILQQINQTLEASGWSLNALTASGKHLNKSDDVERFVMVSRSVPDDAKQLAASISSNMELLFRRATPEDNPPHQVTSPSADNDNYRGRTKPFPVSPQDKDNLNNSEKCVKSWMEDYDYVHLQGKEDFERQQKELLEKENIIKQSQVQLGQEQINQFKKLEQEVIKPVENDVPQWISASPSDSSSALVCTRDRQLLAFYAEQCKQHFVTLLSAVDAFFGCVGAGQPPRIFVAHSKFVILSAHKLVFIGDTLSRQASSPEVANRVMNASNVLCDLLKTVVGATKTAALNYPNTAAVQDMVDRVTDLSHHAQQFKEQLLHMAKP
uniref:Breast cancer anti-estrogen resistance protein 1 n=1 Tax=Oryzias latipes TaxID=8090 RepID=A0A3P9L1W7_ORYLA